MSVTSDVAICKNMETGRPAWRVRNNTPRWRVRSASCQMV